MSSDEVPAQFIFAADQSYAQAQERLNELVSQLARDMQDRPNQSDSAPWAVSVLMMMKTQDTGGSLAPTLLEVWQAALYRLARQQLSKSNA